MLTSSEQINCLGGLSRAALEDFAADTAAAGTAEHVAQIFDQYLSFLVEEPDLFSLGIPKAYHALNSAATTDEALDTLVDRIVSGLFSVIVTMGM
jgi:sec1 family domain-containing protein 1